MTITTINIHAQPKNKEIEFGSRPRGYVPFKLDSLDLRDVRIDYLRKLILRSLDSISETNNYYFLNTIKYFRILGGEFKVKKLYPGNFEYSGTCGLDNYRFNLREVYWDRNGKKFQLKFNTIFYGDKEVEISIVEERFIEFLKIIRTEIKKVISPLKI